jgi:hypothetical protein
MQCKDFEAVLEQEGLDSIPLAAKAHLAECSACQNLLADLTVLVSCARELPAEVDPPERLWISLRAQMEAEGLIQEPRVVPAEPSPWWQSLSSLFRPRVLATAGAGLAFALAAFLTVHRAPVAPTKMSTPSAAAVQAPSSVEPKQVAAPPSPSIPPASAPASHLVASTPKPRSKSLPATTTPDFKPAPSDNVYPTMQVTLQDSGQNQGSPALRGSIEADATLRENLRVINEVIAQCQKRLKKYPHDTMARDYLESAYQQRAELLAAILESGRSEQ